MINSETLKKTISFPAEFINSFVSSFLYHTFCILVEQIIKLFRTTENIEQEKIRQYLQFFQIILK